MDATRDVAVCWRDLLAETVAVIGDRVHARWLCETAAATDSRGLLAALDEVPTTRMVAHLDSMVTRYRLGEPVQYVLGHWGFRRLDLAIDRRVLIPRPETELLVERAVAHALTFTPRTIADLGTGSGAIGLALADELPLEDTEVWLSDVSPDAVAVARANLAGIGRRGRNVRITEGSWFEPFPTTLVFDVVVANPPYVALDAPDLEPVVRDWEPAAALFAGPDGLDALRELVPAARPRLRPQGWLLLEHGADQGAAVRRLLADHGFVDVVTRSDLAGHERMSEGRRP